jgi:hypothetical protein
MEHPTMVEDARPPEGSSSQGERRKTAIVREGPPRPEVLAALEEDRPSPPVEKVEQAIAKGTLLEGLAGTGAAVLSILAILGTHSLTLVAVGVIVLGGAILISAGGFAAIAHRFRSWIRFGQIVAGGAGFEALIGAAAVAGGILVLVNVAPTTLLPISVIVLGASFLLASGGLQFFMSGPAAGAGASAQAGSSGGAVEILVGLAAAILGILALAGMSTLLFSEIAVLALGTGVLAKCMAYSTHVVGGVAQEPR